MRRALLALGFALLLPACNFVSGSGKLATESKEVTAFSKVSVADAIHAVISTGPTSIRVTTDDNVIDYVDVAVQEGVLKIGVRDSAWIVASKGIEVRISTPELTAIDASGASRVEAQPPAGERFEAAASGASQVEISGLDSATLVAKGSGASTFTFTGAIDSLDLVLSGASSGCLSKLESAKASVNLSGASSAQIVASGSVSGALSGASNLEVAGAPQKRTLDISGESNVEYR
ncbi:MAG TPA: DUF2807 domain-containing protein [Myxococcales bacterium]|jgi:hypothetical protein